MKCFVVFVLVVLALAAVAMAQQGSSFEQETENTGSKRVPELGEFKRDKRGFIASRYIVPSYYGARYITHHYAPYAYYRSYPHYGYRTYY